MFSQYLNVPLWIVLGVAVVMGVGAAVRAMRGETDILLNAFWRERADVPFAEQQVELTLRMAAAKVKRLVSEAVIADPAGYERHIARIVKSVAMEMAGVDRAAAKTFVSWAENAHLQELLYPKAFKLVWKLVSKPGPALPPDADLVASLRVRG